jgi:hypothetical protein
MLVLLVLVVQQVDLVQGLKTAAGPDQRGPK